jgi:glycolate oxidase
MQEGRDYAVLHEFVTLAKRNVTQGTWDYIVGGAETETTQERNRVALDSITFRPRVLRDVEHVDTSGTLLGLKLQLPLILAPIGSLQDFAPEGGVCPSRAAGRSGVLHMLSSASAPGHRGGGGQQSAPQAVPALRRGDDAWVENHIERAIASGYKALCFTVDLDWYGRRERDLAKRYKTTSRRSAPADYYQARFSWKSLERLRKNISIPFILKGIAVAEDAIMALEHGVECIYVSNHGGRQLGSRQGLDGRAAGDRRGGEGARGDRGRRRVPARHDIVKAMALGANAVGIGRCRAWPWRRPARTAWCA